MKNKALTLCVLALLSLFPLAVRAEVIDVLIKGIDDGIKTTRDQDYKEAVMNAKLGAIERAGAEIASLTKVENFTLKYDLVESRAKAILLPGFQIMDMGYQTDGTYQVVLAVRVQVGDRKTQEGKLWGKIRAQGIRYPGFKEAFVFWKSALQEKIENQFANNDDGTVTDRKTGLMWAISYEMEENLSKVGENVKSLNKKKFAGHDDWRIPTLAEIASLVKARPSAKLDSGRESYLDPVFDAQKYCWYLWSADTSAEGPLLAYIGEKDGGLSIAGNHFQADDICVACLKVVRSLPPGPNDALQPGR